MHHSFGLNKAIPCSFTVHGSTCIMTSDCNDRSLIRSECRSGLCQCVTGFELDRLDKLCKETGNNACTVHIPCTFCVLKILYALIDASFIAASNPCDADIHPCSELSKPGLNHECIHTGGGNFRCRCAIGYVPSAAGTFCLGTHRNPTHPVKYITLNVFNKVW